MPQLREMTKRLCLAFLLTASLMLVSVGRAIAQETEAAPAKTTETNTDQPETPSAITVPEGNDSQQLQAFLTQLTQTPAPDRSRAGLRAHLNQIHDASQEVFQRDVDEETRLLAVSLISGSLDLLGQYGDRTAADRKAKLIEDLKQSQQPVLATRGRLLEVEGQLSQIDPNNKASIKGVIDQVAQTLQDAPLTLDHGRLAYTTVSILEQLDDPKLVDMAAKAFAPPLKSSDNPDLKSLGASLEGTARRLNLQGSSVKLTGKTISGEEFNIDQWKGKVVIVDFWATWCGPCVAEMPNLKAFYEAQHAHGLEIVGISLDDSRPLLEEFLQQKEIPWPTIFFDPEGGDAMDNPIATYYGVSLLPTVFLVGRDGKVVATDLYGEALTEAATKLLEKE